MTFGARLLTGCTRSGSWRSGRWAGRGPSISVLVLMLRAGKGEPAMRVTATVNGARHVADDVWPGESLLFVLRERMGLPGSKNACEQGECGSCTIYLDGIPV